MKSALTIAALAVLLVAPSPCFALWMVASVSKEKAKEMGLQVSSEQAGQNQVRVELAFKTEGAFEEFGPAGKHKDRTGVELRIGEGKNPLVTVPLREDRSKPGRVVVSFCADRAQLDQIKLQVMVPDSDGGTVYVLRVNEFVDKEKGR